MKGCYTICAGLILLLTLGLIGRLHGQVSEWEDQLKRDPANKELLLNLGKYYHDLGGMEEDKRAVKKAE